MAHHKAARRIWPCSAPRLSSRRTNTRGKRHAPRHIRPHGPRRRAAGPVLCRPHAAGRGVRPRRLLWLSRGRAPRDAARRGAVARHLARRDRPAHHAASLRRPGVSAAAVSPAEAAGRDLHARSDQPRPADAGRRPRHLADRAALLRYRSGYRAGDVPGGAGGHPARHDQQGADLRRQVLPVPRRADGDGAVPEAASAAVVRHRPARRCSLGGAAPASTWSAMSPARACAR